MPAMGPKFNVPVGNPNSNPASPSGRPVRAQGTRKANKPPPLLDDYKFWGDTIPVSFGRRKVKGTIVWSSQIRKVKARRFVDVAISFGYNLAPAVSRKGTTLGAFWFDGKKVFSILKSATNVTYKKDVFTTKTSSRPKGKATNINMQWRLYEGNDVQLPDFLVKQNKGPSAVGFKNMIYLVITNLDFDRYNLANVPEIEALLIDRFDNSKLFYERSSGVDHDGVDGMLTAWDSGTNTLHAIDTNGTQIQSFNFNRMRQRTEVALTGSYPAEIVPTLRRVVPHSMSADPETGLVALAIGHAFVPDLGSISLVNPKTGAIHPGGAYNFPIGGSSASTVIWTEFVHAGAGANDGLFLAVMSRHRFSPDTALTLYRVNSNRSLTFVWVKTFNSTIFGTGGDLRGALFASGEERAAGWGVVYFGHETTLHKVRIHRSATEANSSGLVHIEDGPDTSPTPGHLILGGAWIETTNRVLVRTITATHMEFKQYDCPVASDSVPYATMSILLGNNHDIPHPRHLAAAETSRNTLGLGVHWIVNPNSRYLRILNVAQGDITFQDIVPGMAIHVADDLERQRLLSLDLTQYWDSRKNGYVCAQLGSSLVEPCPGPGFLWPNMSILADRAGVPVGQVIQWMLNYVGIQDAQIDITSLPTDDDNYRVLGGLFESGLDVWEELRNICDIYNLVLTESDGLIKVKYRNRTSHVPVQTTLTDDDVSVGDGTLTSGLHYMDPRDVPRRVEVAYYDPAVGYAASAQATERFPAPPIAIDSSESMSTTLPFVLNRKAAKFLSSTLLFSLWEAVASITLAVGRKHLWLEVGDVVAVNLKQAANANAQMILEIQDIARNPDFTADWVCTEIEDQNGHDFGFDVEDVDYTEEDAESDQDAEPLIFDVPTPEQSSTATPDLLGASVPSSDGGWLGGNLYRTLNETNTLVGYTSQELQPLHLSLTKSLSNQLHSTILSSPLDAITVERVAGDISLLASISPGKLLAEGNLCLIGSDALGWEYLSFQTVTDNANDTYTLSTIIRGRRGTEYLTRAWPEGTSLYLIDPRTFLRIAPTVAAIGTTLSFTSSGIGQEIEEGETLALTLAGNARKPFAPTHPRVTSGTWGSNLTVAFAPRTRGAYNWPDNESLAVFPYDETLLSFEVDILNASNSIVRTYAVSTPQFVYTAAHQTADFASNPLELKLRIYQLSPYGRGFSNLSVVQTS